MKISKKVLSLLICCVLIFTPLIGNVSAIEDGNTSVASLPTDLPEVKFTAYSLTLYDNIAINFKVSADTSVYSKIYVICNFNGQNYKITNYTLSDDDLVFTFKGITPDKFGDIVTTTIFVEYNGQAYKAATSTYSVKQYVDNMLNDEQGASFKTLLVDILNYGAAAQNYTGYKTDALVNADLTDEQKAYGTQNSREYNSVYNPKYSVVNGATASWTSASLALKDSVAIRYTVNLAKVSDLEGVYAEFKVGTQTWKINAEQFVSLSNAKYRINFNKLNAAQLSDTVLVTICDKDGNAISNTFSYSVESYVARMATNSDAKLVALTDAIMKYGDAVVSYVENGKDYDKFINSGITLDFENGSYTVNNSTTANSTYWSVADDGDNSVLKRAQNGGNSTYWGFAIGTKPLVAGKAYKLTFRVKSSARTTLDYIVTSGQNYYTLDYNGKASVGNRKVIGTDWQTLETYFTATNYQKDGANYTIPFFYIVESFWNIDLYFDDVEITPCLDAVNFKLYDNKFAKPFVGEEGDAIVMTAPPEREGYVFDGWYADKNFVNKFSATTILGNKTAYAKWIAAITETEIGNVSTGVTDLDIRVTNANSYPIKFALNTDGKVTISIFTASSDDSDVSKSVVWKRTFEQSGDIGCLINPAVINTGDNLYVSVELANGVTACINNFVVGEAATSRVVEGDVDGNGTLNTDDLISLQQMVSGEVTKNWLGDVDGDGYIATPADATVLDNMLNNVSTIETEKYGRQLVWNEEFGSTDSYSALFSIENAEGDKQISYKDITNVSDGKLNLAVENIDGTNFKVPYHLTSRGNFSFKRGYLEVRAKLSACPGQWASIWLSGEKYSDTVHHGEIDIVETNSSGTSFKPNVHSWDLDSNRLAQYGENAEKYIYDEQDYNKTEYHIFGFEWDETELKFYVDGVLYETMYISYFEEYSYGNYPYSGIFDQFYALRFGNIIYPKVLDANGVMPEFSIDYVRLYQKAGEQFKINGVVQ